MIVDNITLLCTNAILLSVGYTTGMLDGTESNTTVAQYLVMAHSDANALGDYQIIHDSLYWKNDTAAIVKGLEYFNLTLAECEERLSNSTGIWDVVHSFPELVAEFEKIQNQSTLSEKADGVVLQQV